MNTVHANNGSVCSSGLDIRYYFGGGGGPRKMVKTLFFNGSFCCCEKDEHRILCDEKKHGRDDWHEPTYDLDALIGHRQTGMLWIGEVRQNNRVGTNARIG